jgi:L-fuconolactonase
MLSPTGDWIYILQYCIHCWNRKSTLQIVDAHCHVSPVWYEPVESLLFQMDRHGVAQAVLTQLLGQFDNTYQQDCVRRHPGRFASIVAVEPAATDACEQLRRLAAEGATGVRLRPDMRSPGADPYDIWRTAAQCRLAVSCVGTAASFLTPAFRELLQALPELTILLEHLGGLARPDYDGAADTRTGITALARHPNLLLKVPSLGQLVSRGPRLPASGRTLAFEPASDVKEMIGCFGAERLMWGSDFPPVAAREGYGNALGWTRDLLENEPEATRDMIFGATARRVFRLHGA